MKKGLSLIELLAVIAIVALLCAALFPVFSRSKQAAKQQVCLSNLHQIYLGIQLYQNDTGELPWVQPGDPSFYKVYLGGHALACPARKRLDRPDWSYTITAAAAPIPDIWGNGYAKKLSACRAKREGSFPYVIDENHRTKVDGYEGLGERVLLVRANGSAKSVSAFPPSVVPCDPSLGSLNL